MSVLLKLELEGELDGAGAADLVEGVEAAVCAAGAQATRQRLRRLAKVGLVRVLVGLPKELASATRTYRYADSTGI